MQKLRMAVAPINSNDEEPDGQNETSPSRKLAAIKMHADLVSSADA